jgi:hypothetical protein
MRQMFLLFYFLIILMPVPVIAKSKSSPLMQANTTASASIDVPDAGQVVQGSLVIRGSTGIEEFQSYEVGFSYEDDPTDTWFLIQESTTPVQDDILAVWETTTITDGNYTLCLLVTSTDGTQAKSLVNDLRVRNYSPIETDTPTPTPIYVTLAPSLPIASTLPGYTPTPTFTPYPSTPTPLPTNPAVITSSQMVLNLGKGAGVSIALLAILGAYLGLRSILQNNR